MGGATSAQYQHINADDLAKIKAEYEEHRAQGKEEQEVVELLKQKYQNLISEETREATNTLEITGHHTKVSGEKTDDDKSEVLASDNPADSPVDQEAMIKEIFSKLLLDGASRVNAKELKDALGGEPQSLSEQLSHIPDDRILDLEGWSALFAGIRTAHGEEAVNVAINQLHDAVSGLHVVHELCICLPKDQEAAANAFTEEHIKAFGSVEGVSSAAFSVTERNKPLIVFVLGGPGSGKGTQCERIVSNFGFTHISAGDCLRAEKASGSKDGEMINQFMKDGKIVPVEVTVNLLRKAMNKSGSSKFLIDGFPRNLENLEGWKKVMGSSVDVAFVLFLECSQETMEQRLLQRGQTSNRVDDNIETIRKRFTTYQNDTMPIIELYEKDNGVRKVDSTKAVEEVFSDVSAVFKPIQEATPTAQAVVHIKAQVQDAHALEKFHHSSERKALVDGILALGGSITSEGSILSSTA